MSEMGEHPFRMVARLLALANSGLSLRLHPCQQNGTPDLSAGNGHRVVKWAFGKSEFFTVDFERSASLSFSPILDLSAHGGERRDDTTHGTRAQRAVACEDGVHRESTEHSCQQTHPRAGVAAINGDRLLR